MRFWKYETISVTRRDVDVTEAQGPHRQRPIGDGVAEEKAEEEANFEEALRKDPACMTNRYSENSLTALQSNLSIRPLRRLGACQAHPQRDKWSIILLRRQFWDKILLR
ncbi:uncharacterized protein LOC124295523 [Neodiprion lecontei]|uniref:Uncharacterized protein LOC124295523 n=1 Tax=Neodiprion lecontei TaxID=441921 RepID=A0ABM3GNM9_NEOLC|nr:uncharacterized protein LOC124295523 [Neodiprion lecontei]